MDVDLVVMQMAKNDISQVKRIIELSFPIVYRYFAFHSIGEEGQLLVSEVQGTGVGFVKLIDFHIEGKKYSCILWIAVHPFFRQKGIAAKIINSGIQHLKRDCAAAVFA